MEALSQREFDLWREGDEAFKKRLEIHIADQVKTNTDYAERLVALEEHKRQSTARTGILSTVVSSIVSALTTALLGARHG